MNFWTPANIQSLTLGVWVVRPPSAESFRAPVEGVATDSRSQVAGRAFVALQGETFDAHDFLAQVSAAPLVIVSDEAKVPAAWRSGGGGGGGGKAAPAVLRVDSTLRALQRLAGAYRRAHAHLRVVGVTGSNGKTTTTRLLDTILAARYRGSASIKSFNNHIGVPLTLLAARPSDEYVVCEMGMNHAGEIAPLTEMGAPDAAVITSLGRAHIENLGSVEAIAKEKASIFNGLKPEGLAVAPADTALLGEYLRRLPHVVTFGKAAAADLRVTSIEVVRDGAGQPSSQRFTLNGRSAFTLPLLGEHNVMNATAAVAVARRFAMSDEEIAGALAGARPPEMRFNRIVVRGASVVNDAYNASPESVAAALRTFADLYPAGAGAVAAAGASRRVLVLGDMLELGEHADKAHDEVAALIAGVCPPDLLITIGTRARRYAACKPKRHEHFENADAASCVAVAALIQPGDAVLLKASRRMGLERIVKALEASPPVTTVTPQRTTAKR